MAGHTNYQQVRSEVDRVCRDCGRDPSSVVLVAVSKTVGADKVGVALGEGALDFGENRPDDLVAKHEAYPQARWHFIGNVQSRRLRDIVPVAHLVHSVYKVEHLPKIDAVARDCGKDCAILLEVNVSGEESKGGAPVEQAGELLEVASGLEHVQVRGLMTMAPRGDAAIARACFDDLHALLASLNRQFAARLDVPLSELSMGMSEDWREAIAAGATMVRIGRAVFSQSFA